MWTMRACLLALTLASFAHSTIAQSFSGASNDFEAMETGMCVENRTWVELTPDLATDRVCTGGMGIHTEERFQNWICVYRHPCLPCVGWMCFVYDEVEEVFVPWYVHPAHWFRNALCAKLLCK
eukprot:1917187-Rhodomonas_salina.2